jgi:DNA-binding response OmpR family regulator
MVRREKACPKATEPATSPDRDEADERVSTVLIVDDDPTARLALAAMLAPDGHHIAFASDAAEVRTRLARINPDVILCDLVMADMCGDEFIRWLQTHERWSLVPVVAVTRIDNPVVRVDLLLTGADIVLVKPCGGSELRAQVQAALRTRHKYQRLAAQSGQVPHAGRYPLQRSGTRD